MLIIICFSNAFQLNFTILSHGLEGKDRIRATTVAAYGMCGTIGAIINDELGGYLFELSIMWPFILCLCATACLFCITIGLACCGYLQ